LKPKGYFTTFEGPEGSGKSTQIKKAASYLRRKGHRVLVLREPGGTRVSEAIRRILLDHRLEEMSVVTELLLYLAARSQIVQQKILPALHQGKIVICDRYEDSTMAYQGFGRKLSLTTIAKVSEMVRGKTLPKRTFLLDLPPKKGLRRGGRMDRMEKQSLLFHERVRRGFLKLAKINKKRFLILDAMQSKEVIAGKIRQRLTDDLR